MSPFRDPVGPPLLYRSGPPRRGASPRPGEARYPGGVDDLDGYRGLDGYREADEFDGLGEVDEFADFDMTRQLGPQPVAVRGLAGLPPARSRPDLLRLLGPLRSETAWLNYAILVGVPLVLILLVANLLVGSPASTRGQSQQPNAAMPNNGMGDTGTTGTTATGNPAAGNAAAGNTTPNAAAAGTGGGAGMLTVYEAEDTAHNALGPTTKVREVAGASGGKVVTSIGHGTPAGDVTFNTVTAQAAGKYAVVIYYLLPDTVAHRLALWVNGKGPTILSFPGLGAGATDKIGTLQGTVTLNAGTNVVRFSNATMKFGPDLDRITVAPQQ